MRLIVGLGNVGPEYESTPHNAGFWAIDALAGRAGIRLTRPESKALVGKGSLAGQEVVLAKPQTMMNLSGVAVRSLLERYECDPAEMIVIFDEIDLPWGMLRVRTRGRNSTHNGLRSIISSIGSDEFIRIRMGVQPEQVWGDRKDYLLSPIAKNLRETAEQEIADAADAVELVLTDGVEKAMTRFNRKVAPGEEDLE
jgi:peptidyl-tRNA hydrolase, PTH1 family